MTGAARLEFEHHARAADGNVAPGAIVFD